MSRIIYAEQILNKQIKVIEELNSCLFKTEALINLGTNTNFLELTKLTIHQYLSILEDFVSQAIKYSAEALDLALALTH